VGSIFDGMIPTSPIAPLEIAAFLLPFIVGFGDSVGCDVRDSLWSSHADFGFGGFEIHVRFSPLCPAALSHSALVSQV
jgi:hypothetical protein